MDLTGINRRPRELFALSEQLLRASQRESFPYEMELMGTRLVVFANVFSPRYNVGADLFAQMLPLREGIDFLEVGPGTGAVSVFAALAGARVVAVDVSPDAVANTRANAALHGLDGRIDAREGDVFDAAQPGERFDLIFWNTPFGWIEPGTELTPLQRSTFDPGYEATRRYVHEGPRHLKPGGLLTIGFSSTLGRLDLIEEIAAEAGMEARVARRTEPGPEFPIVFELIHLVPRGS